MSSYTFDNIVQFDPVMLDHLYQLTFGYKTDGTFVEVGAYDGVTYSHTVGLAKIGWRGVYIEPVPELAEKCRRNHEDNLGVTVLECACGDHNGFANVHVDENSCCGSTLNPIVCKQPKLIEVELRTLDTLLMQEEIDPGFDLLSIDVEFAECEVLKGFDVARWKPKMIIIELCETHGGEKQEWAAPARAMVKEVIEPLYSCISKDAINNVYVLKK
jgi:FkbM family methyltransferase